MHRSWVLTVWRRCDRQAPILAEQPRVLKPKPNMGGRFRILEEMETVANDDVILEMRHAAPTKLASTRPIHRQRIH